MAPLPTVRFRYVAPTAHKMSMTTIASTKSIRPRATSGRVFPRVPQTVPAPVPRPLRHLATGTDRRQVNYTRSAAHVSSLPHPRGLSGPVRLPVPKSSSQCPAHPPPFAGFGSFGSRARLRRANRPAQAGSRRGPPRSDASRLRAPPPLTGHASRDLRSTLGNLTRHVTSEPPTRRLSIRPTQDRVNGAYASLRDGLRPPLTRPLRRALVLRYGFGGSPWSRLKPRLVGTRWVWSAETRPSRVSSNVGRGLITAGSVTRARPT